jgi:hypothetical protein
MRRRSGKPPPAPTTTPQSTDAELLIDGRDNSFDLCYRREQREILARALSSLSFSGTN